MESPTLKHSSDIFTTAKQSLQDRYTHKLKLNYLFCF